MWVFDVVELIDYYYSSKISFTLLFAALLLMVDAAPLPIIEMKIVIGKI